MKLNLGCGQNPLDGFVNVDWIDGPGVDLMLDLENDTWWNAPGLRPDTVDQVYASHLIEHIRDPLAMMQNLWHVCSDGALAEFACPYGSSDDADEDPTHVRRMFINSWAYFAQPTYWRGNTEYTGDWRTLEIHLQVPPSSWAISQAARPGDENGALNHLYQRVHRERNVVEQMVAILECRKPARERQFDLREGAQLVFEVTEPNKPMILLGAVKI
jgi:hypothetical protein